MACIRAAANFFREMVALEKGKTGEKLVIQAYRGGDKEHGSD